MIAIDRDDEIATSRYIHQGLAAGAGLFVIHNVEEIAVERPESMTLPPRELRERQAAGDGVKLVWGDGNVVERMWVRILRVTNDRYTGTLDNNPYEMPALEEGIVVEFGPEHILELGMSKEAALESLENSIETGEPLMNVSSIPAGVSRETFNSTVAEANAGDLEAINRCVGFYLDAGMIDNDDCRNWLQRGAEAGDADDAYLLGESHLINDSMGEAVVWWTRAMELGHAGGFHRMGNDAHGNDDEALAVTRWTEAARLGSASAAMCLTQIAEEANDDALVDYWLNRGVELESTVAMWNVALRLEAAGDIDAARVLCERGALLGDQDCKFMIGRLAWAEGHVDTAQLHMHDAAADGHPGAIFVVAQLALDDGRLDDARQWIERGLETEDVRCMDLFGDYWERLGDSDTALIWWQRAAAEGNVDSMYSLGWAAHAADDHEQAARWWDEGRSLGSARCSIARGHRAAVDDEDVELFLVCMQEAIHAGNPEGLFSLGLFKIDSGDVEVGWDLIDTAARAGFEKAITYTEENPRENQS